SARRVGALIEIGKQCAQHDATALAQCFDRGHGRAVEIEGAGSERAVVQQAIGCTEIDELAHPRGDRRIDRASSGVVYRRAHEVWLRSECRSELSSRPARCT